MSESFLVDDNGEFWDADSYQLRAELSGFAAGDGFSTYVIKNLGFVRIDKRGASTTVWMRPATVSPVAVAQLLFWIGDNKIERVLLCSYAHSGWRHTILGAGRKTVSSLAALISASASEEFTKGENIVALPISAAASGLGGAVRVWHEVEGDWPRLSRAPEFKKIVGDRFSLYERRGECNFILQEYGSSMPACATAWLKKAVGLPVHDHPDREYGWSCMQNYRKTIDSGRPQLQHVDAYVSWPGSQRQRRRYTRLMLPLSFKGRRAPYVLSATVADGEFDFGAAG